MEILGDRKFIEIPGTRTHELPPLLVSTPAVRRLDKIMDLASQIVESEDLLAGLPPLDEAQALDRERRRIDLALNLVEQYIAFLNHWHWGDGVIEWIRQCETTFETISELRPLLRADVWPHAGRSSFVTLLEDKAVKTDGVDLEKAVGLRLTFRQPPPISCFSNQFLLYLNSTLATTAFETWAHMVPEPISCLPPERFSFQVFNV
jgi:hypothetical protein